MKALETAGLGLAATWLLLSLAPAIAFCETPSTLPAPSRAMSLPEALAFAREHQPSLRIARARVAAALEETKVARAHWLPTLGMTAQLLEGTTNNSTASYLGVRGVDLPRVGTTRVTDQPSWAPSASTLLAAGVNQELFDFGRIAAQAAVADTALSAERWAGDRDRLRVALLVKDGFYGVLAAKEVLRTAGDAYARARVHSDLAAAGVRAGMHAPIELTRVEADLTRFDVARVQAASSVLNAQTVLAAAVGTPELVLDARGDGGPLASVPPLQEALRTLEERAPSIRAASDALENQRATSRAIAVESSPDLVLSAGISARAGGASPSSGPEARGDGFVPEVPNWHAGVILRWPIYDPVVRARTRSAIAREEIAAGTLALVQQQEASAVERAYIQLENSRSSLVALARAADAARANDAQAEARFKAGLSTAVELADAEALRTGAEIQLAIAQFDVARACDVIASLLAEDP